MKKLRLDLDSVAVETFEAEAVTAKRGTVHAQGPGTDPGFCAPSFDWYCSYGQGCTWPAYTCGGPNCAPNTDYTQCFGATCDLSCEIC
jgi:hypothetical protein